MPESLFAVEGATGETVEVPVSAGQYERLSHDIVKYGSAPAVHKMAVGPYFLPGVWAVVAYRSRREPQGDAYYITLGQVTP
jgi:hypothetical protein